MGRFISRILLQFTSILIQMYNGIKMCRRNNRESGCRHTNIHWLHQLEGNYVAYLCPYLDYITGEMNGVVLIEMDCDEIWEILRKDSEKDSTQYSILNQENHVIYTTDSDQRKATEEMLDENKFSYVEELNNGWKIVSNISKTEIFLSVVKSLIILFTILLLVCFSIIIIVSIKKRMKYQCL